MVVAGFPSGVAAEQASEPTEAAAAELDAGANHTCVVLNAGNVRCWGFGGDGRLGYGNTNTIGDDETPSSVGPVNLGGGRTATAISAGDFHSCALLNGGDVRCWGFGGNGRLGYGNTNNIGDNETPGSAGPVNLGAVRTATAITVGGAHTCALLNGGDVRCWGFGFDGQLGYGNTNNIGDNETPGSAGPVDLGAGNAATAITAGSAHTCALLEDGSVRCWGLGSNGQLGYANANNIGDKQAPGSARPVDLGTGRTAKAISAGDFHTCALLDNGTVRCWGYGADGELGYSNTDTIGDDEAPGSVGPVNLGAGRTAKGISAGARHTCALLDNNTVRCWGSGADGRLGYGNTNNVGDNETPDSVGPVDLGVGRTAVAISAGARHTCAQLDDSSVRCWGFGGNGRLGYCNQDDIGDNEAPALAGPIDLGQPGRAGVTCAGHGGGVVPGNAPVQGASPGQDKTAPGVSRFGVTNSPFVVGGRTPIFGNAAARRHKKGTTFRYTLSEAATVNIVISQRRPGRRNGIRCVAPRRSLRKKATCTRIIRAGTLTRASHTGAKSVGFSGRIGSKALTPGSYSATITATDAAKNTSGPKTISFTIVKR